MESIKENRLIEEIIAANHVLQGAIEKTPLQYNQRLSNRYGCHVYLKREDLQIVRSFKIRGAYHFIRNLSAEEMASGVVCASAGNHAQGVAYSCRELRMKGKIFMPTTTPRQKVSQVMRFGGAEVEIILTGDTFDDSYLAALACSQQEGLIFVHPFDDQRIIAGQGTVGLEIMEETDVPIDYLFVSIGGGGLAAGVGTYVKEVSPHTKLIGVEPEGAASMKEALVRQEVVTLDQIEKFVDGAAVKQVGRQTFEICRRLLDGVVTVPEGKVCTTILELYNECAIVAEPAGALPIAALDLYSDQIKGKNVVCVVSGGNNDIDRMQEIKERSLIFEGLKHYFLITFPQRSGALREFINFVLGPDDDITRFEYTKRNNRENGPALVGIELKSSQDYTALIERLKQHNIEYTEINRKPDLFQLLI